MLDALSAVSQLARSLARERARLVAELAAVEGAQVVARASLSTFSHAQPAPSCILAAVEG